MEVLNLKKTICELFAGVGGFRVGFERASSDWQTVWFSQWEPGKKAQHAYECYVSHFGVCGLNNNVDIACVDKTSIPDHNVLVGGFPCQDYSVAHNAATASGIEGKKGVLWWEIYNILLAKKPAFVLLENVDRLLKSPTKQRGRDFGIILYCFTSLGYHVEWRVINAAEYGEVQRRRRVFIFAYREDTQYHKKHTWMFPAYEKMQNVGFFAKTFPIKEIAENSITVTDLIYDDVINVSDNFSFKFENCGYAYGNTICTCAVEPVSNTQTTVLRDIVETNVDSKYYISDVQRVRWEYLKGAKKFERTSKTGYTYMYSEGPVGFPDSLDLPARTMLTTEGTCNRCSHAIVDPLTKELRILTPVECERINGFDDNWTLGMPERMRYFCMGNALVVPLITKMALTLNNIVDNEE